MTSQFESDASYDVLFIGEQTSLVMRLVAGLVRAGYRPAILNGPRLIEKLKVECNLDVDHFECPPVHLPGRYRAPWIQRIEWLMLRSRLRSVIRKINPAVIHLNYIKAEQAMLAELGHHCPPIIATVWGTDLHRDAAQSDRLQQSRIAEVLQHAKVVTADSLELLDCARELAPQKHDAQLKLILWGIDVDAFSGPAADRSAARWRQQLELPTDAPLILAPRRIDPRYSPQRVLQAFAGSQAARRGFLVFKIFGDNPQTEQRQQAMLTQRAEMLGLKDRIRFAPPCPYGDLPGLYCIADLACFLLSHDGTPTTAFELMAAEVPIVMSDIPDYTGTIVPDHHACLVPPSDTDAVAATFDRILGDPDTVQSQVRWARKWVSQHATIGATVENFLAAYKQATSNILELSPRGKLEAGSFELTSSFGGRR